MAPKILCRNCKHVVMDMMGLQYAKCGVNRTSYTGSDQADCRFCMFVNKDGHCKDFEQRDKTLWEKIFNR